jgi:hypothetical protein
MSDAAVNYLTSAGFFKDYQHASRLYLSDQYALTPKPGWIYYVEFNVNQQLINKIVDKTVNKEFNEWYNKSNGNINLLAKTIDMPKFTVQTERLNQYNRSTLIQKKIDYSDVAVTFHDDMANSTTNLWKSYYQYYFGDSVGLTDLSKKSQILPKYVDTKYNSFTGQYNYGLNNNQTIPFFNYIKIYQLFKGKYSAVKLVNPIIKDWSHDQLDQTSGNKLLTSKMTVQYETVIYDTSSDNDAKTVGFNSNHYDSKPGPFQTTGNPDARSRDSVFGKLSNPGPNPGDLLTAAVNQQMLTKAQSQRQVNLGGTTVTVSGVNPNGYQDFQSFALNKMQAELNPLGITVPSATSTADQTEAVPVDTMNGTTAYSDRYDVGF